jgi:formamidopyrimidine-DNA glycosylase
MPELPDVESFKIYLDSTSLHQQIEDVHVKSKIVLKGISSQKLNRELIGREFAGSHRYGKYLFVKLDDDRWLVLHFGMTGNLVYFKNLDDKPEYDQVLFEFVNGYHLAYTMPRKLGMVTVIDEISPFIEEKNLGPDAMDPDFDFQAFKKTLSGRRGMAKSTLMNQSIIAGIGNIYSDEILFQSRVHPKKTINHMDEGTLKTIYNNMRAILQTAIDHMADTEDFPDSYLIPHRRSDQVCPNCGGELENIKVSGRSGYYCPNCQKK